MADEEGSSSNPATPTRTRTRMLLACDRCRQRKQRCDRNLPACNACAAAGAACMTSERDRMLSMDSQHVPRGYIEELEQKVAELESEIEAARMSNNYASDSTGDSPTVAGPSTGKAAGKTPIYRNLTAQSGQSTTYSADSGVSAQDLVESLTPGISTDALTEMSQGNRSMMIQTKGFNLSRSVLAATKVYGSDPLTGSRQNPLFEESITSLLLLKPNDVLKGFRREVAIACIGTYFQFIHVHFPFLEHSAIVQHYDTLLHGHKNGGEEQLGPAKSLVVYMVVIIGMTISQDLEGVPVPCFPHLLYSSIVRSLDLFDDDQDLESTQAIVLIVLYSLYDPFAGSSWHLVDLAVRRCLTLGFHRNQGIQMPNDRDLSNKRLWVFWTVYSLDVMIGTALGRPFSIVNDESITTPLPANQDFPLSPSATIHNGQFVAYFRVLSRLRTQEHLGYVALTDELASWRETAKQNIAHLLQSGRSGISHPQGFQEAMYRYLDLTYLQGIVAIPQFTNDYPNISPMFAAVLQDQPLYEATKEVMLALDTHKIPISWISGYNAFACGLLHLLCLTQINRRGVSLANVFGIFRSGFSSIETVASLFDGLKIYSKVYGACTEMMILLMEAERNPTFGLGDGGGELKFPNIIDLDKITIRRYRCAVEIYITEVKRILASL